MLPRIPPGCRGGRAIGRWRSTALGDLVEEPEDLTQTSEVEQVLGCRSGGVLEWGSEVGAAQGEGGVAAVGEPDNEIGIRSATLTNDLDTLPTEGVVGVGDSDESRRRLG
jgi:hypothetical protein